MFLSYCSVAVAAASIGVSNYNSKTADLSIMDQVAERILIDEGVQCLDFNQYYVKDLKGNVFLVKLGDNGFAIIDVKTSIPIEVQPDMECPYSFSIESKGNNYYFGFGNYFFKNGEKYRNLSTGRNVFQEYMVDYQEDFDYRIKELRKDVDYENLNFDITKALEDIDAKYVSNYEILKYDDYAENITGSCGYVSACSLLNYYDKTLSSRIVDDKYYDEKGCLNRDESKTTLDTETILTDKLVSYKLDKNPTSFGFDIQFVLRDYLADQCIYWPDDEITYCVLTSIGLTHILDQNIPVIGSGYVNNPENDSSKFCHSFVIYGYYKINNATYFLANWGWNDENISVSVPAYSVDSYVYIDFNLQSFKKKLIIDPDNFELTNTYSSFLTNGIIPYSSLQSINSNLSISSSSIRCGVFENEFDRKVISLSSFKKSFSTSFLHLSFSEPVLKLRLELSKWSQNECVDENNGTALIKYKNFYYPDYDKIGAFLPDIANECDYEMKQWNIALDIFEECVLDGMDSTITLTINIPNKTKQIEIITQCNDVNNSSSLDKGRLCIHSMEAKIYA